MRLQLALKRCILLLVDQDDAIAVNEALGEREYGQEVKSHECLRALDSLKLESPFKAEQVLVFDVLKDDRLRLVQKIDQQLTSLRAREVRLQEQFIAEARELIENAAKQARPALEAKLEGEIKAVISKTLSGIGQDQPPMADPLVGVYALIETSRAVQVHSSCRRFGNFKNFDIYATIRASSGRACSDWMYQRVIPIWQKLNELKNDPSYSLIIDRLQFWWH